MNKLIDPFNRAIDYVRLSVTDRCNYKCVYCRPQDSIHEGKQSEFLSYEEMVRLIRLFSELGVKKVRLTGGEPLVRKGIVGFIQELGKLPEITDLSLSTNAHLLKQFALPIHQAGVKRVNISLDTLNPQRFTDITRGGDVVKVIEGIDEAVAVGLGPVKLNMVVMKGFNDHEIEDMLDFTVQRQVELRFIETMPIGSSGIKTMGQHYPAKDILKRVKEKFGKELIPVTGSIGAGPAKYYQVGDSSVRVGVISAVSRHFCASCNRVRLTAKGDLVLCLGQDDTVSLRDVLRNGADDTEVKSTIVDAIALKPEKHEFSSNANNLQDRDMVALGG
jgi:GTP 3',8-cyclase